MKRYVPNENNGDATLALNSDKPWKFKKGEPRPPGSGRGVDPGWLRDVLRAVKAAT